MRIPDSHQRRRQLTGKGKRLAADVIRRHHYIKDFLKMVCNVGDQVADRDACRFEHIASEEVLSGIREFVRSGRVANRVIKGQDLNVVYMPGSYIFDVGFLRMFYIIATGVLRRKCGLQTVGEN